MDSLPPPATTSNGALQLQRRRSQSRSPASARVRSHSPSAAPELPPPERSEPDNAANNDQPNFETHSHSGSPTGGDSHRGQTTALREDGGTTEDRTSSPEISEGDRRPRKRRRLSLAGTSAAEPSSALPHGPGDPGPSRKLPTGAPSYPQATASSRPQEGPIDVDALPDSPIFVPSSSPPRVTADDPSESVPNEASTNSRHSPLHPASPTALQLPPPARSGPEPLTTYVCPICFSSPTNPTMTPCGHVCCGECLFSAVKSTIERSAYHGPASQRAK